MRRRLRTVTAALPTETASCDGLAYSLWLPEDRKRIRGGVVILHGAGSCKESHHDYARFVRDGGFAAIAFDQRGHGASEGPFDGRALQDVATVAEQLRIRVPEAGRGDSSTRLALRGSSMGGYLAILAAPLIQADAVVAICPASAEGMRRALDAGEAEFDVDVPATQAFLSEHDLGDAVGSLRIPLLLLHAEGDERVPVQHSRELEARMTAQDSRLITLPGGHHRSIQHDEELQAVSVRWIGRMLA